MQKKNQTDRELNDLRRQMRGVSLQIRQVARQVGRCWALLQKRPNYIEPPLPRELDIRISKM